MAKVSIAIDRWKVPIYERHLSEAGYASEHAPGLIPDPDHLFLKIQADDLDALNPVLHAAAMEAARYGAPE